MSDTIKYLLHILKIHQTSFISVNLLGLKIIRLNGKVHFTLGKKKAILCLIILKVKNQTNDKQICKENLSSSVENITTYLHYLTCDGEF